MAYIYIDPFNMDMEKECEITSRSLSILKLVGGFSPYPSEK